MHAILTRVKALDLYCGAGGMTKGLQRLNFEVTGVDIKPQPRYCGDHFICKNVLDLTANDLQDYDLVVSSPPCQHSVPMAHRELHYNFIPKTRALLKESGVPYVIENVPTTPLDHWITLCGTMFTNLRVIRHRRFECSFYVDQLFHISQSEHPPVYSFDRRERRLQGLNEDDDYVTVAGNNCSLGAMSEAMGIDWMTRPEIAQAIPPVYATYIGRQFLNSGH